MKKLLKSLKHGFCGIGAIFKSERNFRIHCVLGLAAIIFGVAFDISVIEWVAILFAIGLVLAAEAFNTSIERLSDAVQPEFDLKIKVVKDAAAAGVLINAVITGLIGALIFLPKLWNWMMQLMS